MWQPGDALRCDQLCGVHLINRFLNELDKLASLLHAQSCAVKVLTNSGERFEKSNGRVLANKHAANIRHNIDVCGVACESTKVA